MAATHTDEWFTLFLALCHQENCSDLLGFSQIIFSTSFGSFHHCYRYNNYLLNLFGDGRWKKKNLSETKAESTLVAKETDHVPKRPTFNQLRS